MNEKHILVLFGSVREDNYTLKAVRLLDKELKLQKAPLTYEIIDPATLTLTLPGQPSTNDSAEILQTAVKRATGVIIASPEYHGGISSVMKLIVDNLGFPSVLSGKPIALLGVAAGSIGAIKSLEQLRSICSHVGALVLPGPVSIANVQKVFDQEGNCDAQTEEQVRKVVTRLIDYIDDHICPRIALENMVRLQEKN
ncbi:MAG: hypothetical protein S4CHLAM123_15440 [Chlamydiales bacterium]|nr:hypothetical protein [Chlamydiales bacterium]